MKKKNCELSDGTLIRKCRNLRADIERCEIIRNTDRADHLRDVIAEITEILSKRNVMNVLTHP